MQPPSQDPATRPRLLEVVQLFLRLGLTAFGGPAAHIAIMHDEVVTRRQWVNEQEFLDLLGAANLIPGPTSTELAIYLGYRRVGWIGLVLGGLCFVLPAMLITLLLSWAYVRFGTTPVAGRVLYGILPVVIAIVAQALWGLGRRAVKNWLLALIGLGAFGLYMVGVNILLLLLAGGLTVLIITDLPRRPPWALAGALWPLAAASLPALAGLAAPFSLLLLFLDFLKVGATLYGSGYVLLAFLHADLVTRLGWLTDKQLIDAIAIGQVTPGPVFTTATFIGYLLGGLPGALLATLGIFLPSFIFVALSGRLLKQIRSSRSVGNFLDGVNVVALGLMLGVTVQLGRTALADPLTISIAALSLFLLLRFRLNTTWLIACGALVGLVHTAF